MVDLEVAPTPAKPRPLVVASTFTLALFGLGVSIYLTIEHLTGNTSLACPSTGAINCARVTSSDQSYFLGVPVAILGLAYFVVAAIVNSPPAWYVGSRRLHQLRLLMVLTGIAFVLWLIAAELLIIGAICLWCTAVHVIALAMGLLVVNETPRLLGWGQADDGEDNQA